MDLARTWLTCLCLDALSEGRPDGCARDQVWSAPESGGAASCHTFPPCGAGDACPVGVVGATSQLDDFVACTSHPTECDASRWSW